MASDLRSPYDRLIENPAAFYLTFDNKEVGRMQAREVFKVKPEGNYAFIKGSSSDPNADFLFSGQMEVLKEAIDSGKVKNVGEAYTVAGCRRTPRRTWSRS